MLCKPRMYSIYRLCSDCNILNFRQQFRFSTLRCCYDKMLHYDFVKYYVQRSVTKSKLNDIQEYIKIKTETLAWHKNLKYITCCNLENETFVQNSQNPTWY